MKNRRDRAIDYFTLRCGQNDFWQWAPDRSVLWSDGSVVVSRDELIVVLRYLAPFGLPGFGALVHLLAGCRGQELKISWGEPSARNLREHRVPCTIVSRGKEVRPNQRVLLHGTPELISAAATRLSHLPHELDGLLDNPEILSELAGLVFSDIESPFFFEGIIDLLDSNQFSAQELNKTPWNSKYPNFFQDLSLLGKSFQKLPDKILRQTLINALGGKGKLGTGQPLNARITIREIRQFELPDRTEWDTAIPINSGFCAASLDPTDLESTLVVGRSTWEGVTQIARWESADPDTPVVLNIVEDEQILVHQPDCMMLPKKALPSLNGVFAQPVVLGGIDWLPLGTIRTVWSDGHVMLLSHRLAQTIRKGSFAQELNLYNATSSTPRSCVSAEEDGTAAPSADDFVRFSYADPERIVLSLFSTDGQFCSQNYGPEIPSIRGRSTEFVSMAVAWPNAVLGLHNGLVIFDSGTVVGTHSFNRAIKNLVVGKFGKRTGIAICFKCGVKLHWRGCDDMISIDDEVANPVASFTPDGSLVVVGDDSGSVYRLNRDGITTVLSFAWKGSGPVSVMPTGSDAEFATLSRHCLLQVWTMA